MELVDVDGYEIVDSALPAQHVAHLLEVLRPFLGPGASPKSGGVRGVFRRNPEVAAEVLGLPALSAYIGRTMGENAFAVGATLFTKIEHANWRVPWHQDLTIAVRRRLDVETYGPWSLKDGINYVQPPREVLEAMLAVRIHLDDCGPSNGPLRVRPGTHRKGKLRTEDLKMLSKEENDIACCGSAGSIVAMRPLLLHASSSATAVEPRRVLHIEFSSRELEAPLMWNERWNMAASA